MGHALKLSPEQADELMDKLKRTHDKPGDVAVFPGGVSVKKPSKYRNKRVSIDGIKFDSQAEARRYSELRLLVSAGEIGDLQIHPRFPLEVAGVLVCTYVADFSYRKKSTGAVVIEDVKGVRTPEFIIKKKLAKALLGVDVIEIAAKRAA